MPAEGFEATSHFISAPCFTLINELVFLKDFPVLHLLRFLLSAASLCSCRYCLTPDFRRFCATAFHTDFDLLFCWGRLPRCRLYHLTFSISSMFRLSMLLQSQMLNVLCSCIIYHRCTVSSSLYSSIVSQHSAVDWKLFLDPIPTSCVTLDKAS